MTDEQYDELQREIMRKNREDKSWSNYEQEKIERENLKKLLNDKKTEKESSKSPTFDDDLYETISEISEFNEKLNDKYYEEGYEDGDDYKEEIILNNNSFAEYFKQNNFKDVFQKASFTVQMSKNRDESLEPFYKLVTETSLKRILKANRMIDFVSELNIFLNSRMFNDHEKYAFLNGEEQRCFLYALNVKNFDCATKINQFRKKKDLQQSLNYMTNKMAEEEFEILDKLFELSDGITFNNSAVLRLFYSNGSRDFSNIKHFIEKYELDINGLGNTPNRANTWTFAQAVATTDGTKANIFFEQFFKHYGNKVDFNVQAFDGYHKTYATLFNCLIKTEMQTPIKLDRFAVILENCELSEKHIAFISQYLLNLDTNTALSKHYDHNVFKALFSHEKFNSNLYDREAFLNKLMQLDYTNAIHKERVDSNFTVNPTSIILDTFMKYAKPALPMEQHPFITWVKRQNENYSRDTFSSLMTFYKDEIHNVNLENVPIHASLVKALAEFGISCPEKKGLFSFLKKKKPQDKHVVQVKQIVQPQVQEQKKDIAKELFNTVLFEQVKDEQIKKYIESITLNLEQFNSLFDDVNSIENHHYMHNLLPKFLNKTIENYLHFATIDEDEAKDNVMVQLKLINKKTFEVLTNGLEHQKNQIATDNVIHHKVLKHY
jgi:hypothetical protein